MPKTQLIRDHHLLTRNLKLNGNYISNDGEDEGISITDTGLVTIDKNNIATTTDTYKGLFIDYDSTGNAGASQTINNTSLDIDLNSDASTNNAASTILDTGIDIDIVGGQDGTANISTGIDINVSGSDSNHGIKIALPSGLSGDMGMLITQTVGTHLKLAYDVAGYATFTVADNGVTTIATTDSLGSNDANFILDIDGDINFDASGGDFSFSVDGANQATLDSSGNFLAAGTLSTRGSPHTIGTAGNTNATAYTAILNTGETAGKNLTISAGSTVTASYNLNGGDLILASGGGDGSGTSSIQFQTKVALTDAAAERMRIHTDGKVGIGVADPDSLLEIFGTSTQLKLSHNADDYVTFTVADTGDLTIATVGDGTRDSDLTLDADGDIYLDAASGITHFYDAGDADDAFKITVVGGTGATTLETVSDAADGHLSVVADGHVEFDNCAVGFDRLEAVFGDSDVIGGAGTNTDIDFRLSNKYRLEMTADILTNVNLIFPNTSGNFLLVCTTNGDHDVANWKVYESDESAATTANVMWAGGSVPAFTDTGVDIVSFYWDADEQQAYGVASLAFATP